MKMILLLLFFLIELSSFSQKKIDADLLILSNWAIESYSAGVPFLSSDTVVLFRCGNAYGRDTASCSAQGGFGWELFFEEPFEEDEIQENVLIVYKANPPIETREYLHEDLLFWKLNGKKITITGEGVTVKYKIVATGSNRYVLLKTS